MSRPPWRLGLLGVALLRSAWPFPAPAERPERPLARRLQRSRGVDGPRWLGWLTVAALALRFAALYAFTRLRPTP